MEVSRKLEKPVENSNLLAVNSIVQINTESYNKDQKVMLESNVKKSMKKSDMVQSKVLQSKKSENVVITIEEPLPQTFGSPTQSPKKSHDESVIINNMMIKGSEKACDPCILDLES